MTSDENLAALDRHLWEIRIAECHKEAKAGPFKQQLAQIAEAQKELESIRKEKIRLQREIDHAQKKAETEAHKACEQEERKAQKAEERAEKIAQKVADKAEKHARKMTEKAEAAAKKQIEQAQKRAGGRKGRKAGAISNEDAVAVVAGPYKSPRKGASSSMAAEDFTELLANLDLEGVSDTDDELLKQYRVEFTQQDPIEDNEHSESEAYASSSIDLDPTPVFPRRNPRRKQ